MQWGGRPVDNFRGHKVYYEFVDNQVDKIKLWASQLDHSVYIVGTALLGEYDFDKQGFNITLLKPGASYNGYALLDYMPAPDKKAYLDPNSQHNHLFIPLGEDAAEQLVTQNTKLYYAIRGEINGYRGGTFSHRPDAYFAGVNLTYDLIGNTFEFYTDDLLTNKVFEKRVSLTSQ